MLTKRPDRIPDLTLTNLHVKDEDDGCIYYNFADAKDQTLTEEWKIPTNSTFNPNCEIKPNTAYAVWSITIKEPYVTAKGHQRTRSRFDWEWIEPLDSYRRSVMSDTTKVAKGKVLRQAHEKLVEAQNNFNALFEDLYPSNPPKN